MSTIVDIVDTRNWLFGSYEGSKTPEKSTLAPAEGAIVDIVARARTYKKIFSFIYTYLYGPQSDRQCRHFVFRRSSIVAGGVGCPTPRVPFLGKKSRAAPTQPALKNYGSRPELMAHSPR